MQATLSHYRILEQIGAGGMGVVYRAHDEHLDCDVALKVLTAGELADDVARKRFRKEALALSKLNHPNIAVVHDFDTQDGVDFLVEELIPGLSLSVMLTSAPLPERDIVNLGSQLSEGLAAAHGHGVIHRDLNPTNIRVTPDARLKILDFGLARIAQPATPMATTASGTQTPVFAGTLPYMAPEQLLSEKIDARSDIWATGCVLFEMATGRRPFLGSGPALIDSILHQPAPAISKLNPQLPTGLESIILKCLEKDPSLRYQSAREIAVDLHRLNAPSSAMQPERRSLLRMWVALSLLGAILLGMAAALYLRSHRVQALSEKDTVVLADFTNATGDAVFTDALRQGLLVQLNQSPFLNLVSERRVQATLRQMGRKPQDIHDDQVAREVCERNQSKVFIAGSIASLGSQYVLGLKAVNCFTGDVLLQEQMQVARKEEVLGALGKQGTLLRSKLGESLASIQKFDVRIYEGTTTSLEALKAYSLAGKQEDQPGGVQSMVTLLKRAIELDPNFAAAYARLGSMYANLEQSGLAEENIRKAYSLRERATDRERLYIESGYYREVTGELEKAVQVYELYASTYPRDAVAHNNLGVVYGWLGQHDKSLSETLEAFRRAPDSAVLFANLAANYLLLDQLDEAKKILAEAEARQFKIAIVNSYTLAFLRHDSIEMERMVRAASGQPEFERQLLAAQSDTEAYFGRLKKAREFSRRAAESARRNDLYESASAHLAHAALREADLGDSARARRTAAESLALGRTREVMVLAALAYARSGDVRQAQAIADGMARDYPAHTLLHLAWLPTINASVEISKGNPTRSIEILKRSFSVELSEKSHNELNLGLTLQPVYTRGQAFLLLHRGGEAAAEFQKILDHPGLVANNLVGALARLGMARALVLEGDTVKARAEYEEFLNLWKDADPDIPVLIQAKAEYAKLKIGPR